MSCDLLWFYKSFSNLKSAMNKGVVKGWKRNRVGAAPWSEDALESPERAGGAQGSPSPLLGTPIPPTQERHTFPVPHPSCSHGKGTLGRLIFLKRQNIFFFCMALCLPGYKKGGREPQKPPVRQAVMLLEAGVEVGRDVAGSRQKGVWRWNWKGKWILMRNVAEQ